MRVEYINPFIASVRNAFQTMLSIDAERGAPYLRTTAESNFCVSGVIGLSGDAMGTVVLNMSKEVALELPRSCFWTNSRNSPPTWLTPWAN